MKLVCLGDDAARERLGAVRTYIEQDADYHKVFPDIKPDKNQQWTNHKLFIQRDTLAKDGSVDAKGVIAAGIGGRCDRLLVDDIFDYRTAIAQPVARDQINNTFKLVWLTRIEPDGNAVIICTRWHERDLAGEILTDPVALQRYGVLIQRVSQDFDKIDMEVVIPDALEDAYLETMPKFTRINE